MDTSSVHNMTRTHVIIHSLQPMFMFLGCGRKPSLQGELLHFLVTGPLGQPSSTISSCLSNCWNHYFKDRHLLNLVNYHSDDSNWNICLRVAEDGTGLVPGGLSGWFWTVWFIYQQVKSVSGRLCCFVSGSDNNQWRMWKRIDCIPAPGAAGLEFWPTWRSAAAASPSAARPAETSPPPFSSRPDVA